jgi:hypothetical protein
MMPAPKTRQRTKRIQPKPTHEYVLLMMPRFNERKGRVVTYVALRTVKEFTNFKYELIVDARVDGGTMFLDIHGLRPPRLTLPDLGPATFETEFDHLEGPFDVVVKKLRKDVNTFRVVVSASGVVVDSRPEKRFIELITRTDDW